MMNALRTFALASLLLLQLPATAAEIDVDLSPDAGGGLNTTSWTPYGSWSVGGGVATSNCGSGASSLFTVSGKKIVIEAHMGFTQYMHDAAVILIDQAQGADLIKFGETNYFNEGLYFVGNASFAVGQHGNGIVRGDYPYYRMTLDEATYRVERGPAPGDYRESLDGVLGSSIAGRTFFMVIGTNSAYCPTQYYSIHVSTTPEVEPFPFTGFASPVANLPAMNTVNSGRTIPIKFGLGGDRGDEIFAAGSPASGVVSCDSDAAPAALEPVPAEGLVFDATEGQYVLPWKTSKAWAGQCRMFVMTLTDGSTHMARFRFR